MRRALFRVVALRLGIGSHVTSTIAAEPEETLRTLIGILTPEDLHSAMR